LPLAVKMAKELGYGQIEMIEAICKVSDKLYQYPPTKNRTAWFKIVFEGKLLEAKGDILLYLYHYFSFLHHEQQSQKL